MKTATPQRFFALACLLAAGISQAANADDSWTGCYVGVNAGYGRADVKTTELYDVTTTTYLHNSVGAATASGGTFGGQLGCDLQADAWVFGAQLSFDKADLDGSHMYINGSSPANRFQHAINELGTLTGRAGYLLQPEILLYGKAGLAWTRSNHKDTDPTEPYTGDTSVTHQGWLLGGGVEYKIQPHLSLFAEYNYIDLDSEHDNISYSDEDVFSFSYNQKIDYLSVGVNYRF